MRQELLLEFLSEEIPAKFQRKAISDAKTAITGILNDNGAIFDKVDSFVSTRRITLRIQNLLPQTKDSFQKKRGPKTTASQEAICGFLKSNHKASEDLIETDGYYYLNIENKGVAICDVIPTIIENFILNMPWKKSMKWYLEDQNTLSAFWVRPIRSILCVYDFSTIRTYVKSVGITTDNITFGHRFLSPQQIEIYDFNDYISKLEKNNVMLDFFKKREYIDREISQMAAAMGLCVKIDDDLLDEVTGLVEYPFIHMGTIDEQFMKLPSAVLSTFMKVHQKYFTLTYPDSVAAPFFGMVTNVPGTEVMYEGFNRVLRARLSDAAFFFKEDSDVTLEAYAQRLSNVVFHEKLGSIAQKIYRMMSIASTKEEHRVIALCKADLMTQMVGEVPELQGVMGEIYANLQFEKAEVCVAIREHYKPLGASDGLPVTKTGARVAFFDKLDTLVGFLGSDIYPTGSKDPFALRRAAHSIIRLLCDFDGNVLEGETLSWYITTLMTSYSDQGVALNQDTLVNVEKFLTDRFKIYVADRLNIGPDVVDSAITNVDTFCFDCKETVKKIERLKTLMDLPEFSSIKEACKRVRGTLEQNSDDLPLVSVAELSFKDENMINVQNLVLKLEEKPHDFGIITSVSSAILSAYDNVLINDPDPKIREKNFALLNRFSEIIKLHYGVL
ncbi:MAG: glycine--tRNA ligase subunit beta [Holosporales bacterium]|jgi:glycyl-tRNA synthetase beta chain|nr:glycine--tRNA ligase subunit beta [Holosporales bacterium]